ncbi:MAG: DUF952 domain-containing protein [Oligoflexia bacterium]|nr:DUF952 domain-containing protein [Oligoflexia bacterium]
MIYHIATTQDWTNAQENGAYWPSQPSNCPFIHFSFDSQVLRTANRLFYGRVDLVLLKVDEVLLGEALRVEANEPNGEQFPHLYRALQISEVAAVLDFKPSNGGNFADWQLQE